MHLSRVKAITFQFLIQVLYFEAMLEEMAEDRLSEELKNYIIWFKFVLYIRQKYLYFVF